jgi:peptidoglycan/LPS O-acetylase OafA/YrhL
MPLGMPKNRLILLDGLRGVAAILVMLFHQGSPLFTAGGLTVDFFFILSGFVLTLAFENKFENGYSFSQFMMLRVARLWPALMCGIVLGGIALSLTINDHTLFPLMLLAIAMVPALTMGSAPFPVLPVQWSLALELGANALHALLFHRMSNRVLTAFCLLNGALFLGFASHFGSLGLGTTSSLFLPGISRVLFGYSLGILLARQWRRGYTPNTLNWRFSLISIVGIVAAVSMVPAPMSNIARAVGVFFLLPALLFVACRTEVPDEAAPLLNLLGAISYPLYAVHGPLFVLVSAAHKAWVPASSEGPWNLLACSVALTTAYGMSRFRIWYDSRKNKAKQVSRLTISPTPASR